MYSLSVFVLRLILQISFFFSPYYVLNLIVEVLQQFWKLLLLCVSVTADIGDTWCRDIWCRFPAPNSSSVESNIRDPDSYTVLPFTVIRDLYYLLFKSPGFQQISCQWCDASGWAICFENSSVLLSASAGPEAVASLVSCSVVLWKAEFGEGNIKTNILKGFQRERSRLIWISSWSYLTIEVMSSEYS